MIYTPNGWPASPDPGAIRVKTFALPGTTETIRLRADTAPLLLYWARRFNAEVEALAGKPLDDSGYSYRQNKNNPAKLSEHAAGTAIDLNSYRHPNGRRGTFRPSQQTAIHKILADINRVDAVVEWGGDFHITADEMHLDIVGDLAEVQAAIARLHIQPDGSVHEPAQPSEDIDMLRYVLPAGTSGVKAGQQVLIHAGKQVYLDDDPPPNVPLTYPSAHQVANYKAAYGDILGTPN